MYQKNHQLLLLLSIFELDINKIFSKKYYYSNLGHILNIISHNFL